MLSSDILLSLAGWGLGFSLIPTVINGFRNSICSISKNTALLTISFLALIAIAYAQEDLWLAFITVVVSIGLWGLILIQNIMYAKQTIRNNDA